MLISVLDPCDPIVSVEALVGLVRHLSPRLMAEGSKHPARVIGSDAATVVVAVDDDGTLLGSITLLRFDTFSGRHGWLEDLVVDPMARGRGIGLALMREAVRIADREGVEKLLSCSHPRRLAANRTHLSAGFARSDSNLYRMRFPTGDSSVAGHETTGS